MPPPPCTTSCRRRQLSPRSSWTTAVTLFAHCTIQLPLITHPHTTSESNLSTTAPAADGCVNRSRIQTYRNAIVKSKNERRNFVADEFNDECNDFGQLVFRVPCDRVSGHMHSTTEGSTLTHKYSRLKQGILNNLDVEKTVWDRVFGYRGRGMKVSIPSPRLTLPPLGILASHVSHAPRSIHTTRPCSSRNPSSTSRTSASTTIR